MPSSFTTGKVGVVGSNPICKAIHDRTIELIPHGIANIWMRIDGEDKVFHLVTVFGISRQQWDLVAPLTGLFRRMVRLFASRDLWGVKLGLRIAFDNFQTMESNGHLKNSLWFRFVEDSMDKDHEEGVALSSRRHSRMSKADIQLDATRASTPMSAESIKQKLLDQFYEDLRQCGKLRAKMFFQPECCIFI